MSVFKGSATAVVTPFTENGVNYDAFGRLIDFQLKNGADALVVLGTTGEPSAMTDEERREALNFAVKRANKRAPVIAGAGGNVTSRAALLAREASAAGADAILSVTPYYNKCTQKGLIAHFSAVADASSAPVILYNVPSRTGVNMLPATAAALSRHKRVAAVKEASGNVEQAAEITRLCGDKIDVYAGDDALALPILSIGGAGVISVAGNIIPGVMRDLTASFFRGDIKTARELQLKILPLVRALFCEVNPIPVKAALNLMGFDAGIPRLPLTEPDENSLKIITAELKAFKLI